MNHWLGLFELGLELWSVGKVTDRYLIRKELNEQRNKGKIVKDVYIWDRNHEVIEEMPGGLER